MREFKFRCWDKRKNKWIDPSKFAFSSSGYLMVRGMGTKWYALSEFTGLIDRNSKEIYEGDICMDTFRSTSLGSISNPEMETKTVTIVFESGCFMQRGGLASRSLALDSLEIIGNIYESGELAAIEENERCHDDMLLETAKWKREL